MFYIIPYEKYSCLKEDIDNLTACLLNSVSEAKTTQERSRASEDIEMLLPQIKSRCDEISLEHFSITEKEAIELDGVFIELIKGIVCKETLEALSLRRKISVSTVEANKINVLVEHYFINRWDLSDTALDDMALGISEYSYKNIINLYYQILKRAVETDSFLVSFSYTEK
jgi:hypothetical protein